MCLIVDNLLFLKFLRVILLKFYRVLCHFDMNEHVTKKSFLKIFLENLKIGFDIFFQKTFFRHMFVHVKTTQEPYNFMTLFIKLLLLW